MARFIRPTRGVFVCAGNGQGNLTIKQVAGEGEYFPYTFQVDDYFEYAIENKSLNKAETGVGTITSVSVSPDLAVFSRSVDSSSDDGDPINVPNGTLFTLLFKTSDQRQIVVDPVTGQASNPDAIAKTVHVPNLEDLRTQPIPETNESFFIVGDAVSQADGRGNTLWEWVPGSTAAYTDPSTDIDCSVIKSSNATNGRYFLRTAALRVGQLADGSRPYGTISRDATTKDLVSQHPTVDKRFIPENKTAMPIGVYATLTSLLGVATDVTVNSVTRRVWRTGDRVLLRGYLADGDLVKPIELYWDNTDTSTDDLGYIRWRPTDISGSNAGRWRIAQPEVIANFADSTAEPDVKDGQLFKIADTPPAAVTGFSNMRSGFPLWVFPGASAQLFTHSSSFVFPRGRDFTLQPNGSPLVFLKDGTVTYCISGAFEPPKTLVAMSRTDSSNYYVGKLVYDKAEAIVFVGGAIIAPANIAAITRGSPGAGQTNFEFDFTVESDEVALAYV